MRAIIEKLVAAGHAYVAEDHVLFAVASMADYGKLSKRPLDEMIAGARVEVAPYKRDAMDFVLWKPSKPGEPAWPSPAGIATPGRPGWHIECSAMSWKHLGETFDIHGGGIDLVFPHHENEIAQSRCAFHTPVMANTWMHNGFLQVEGEKMSKSLGNFVTIHELLNTNRFGGRSWTGPALRLNMLKTHYRQPIDWTEAGLDESRRIVDTWAEAIEAHGISVVEIGQDAPPEIVESLYDDLNTSVAFAAMHAMARAAKAGDAKAAKKLAASADILGLQRAKWNPKLDEFLFKSAANSEFDERVDRLIDQRNAARKAKDFKESDRIRDELKAMGVVLKDSKDGTTWEIAR
jgi:cysteinyl-tRNA synthetase